ncbi:MAG: TonB-dependent receptor [Pseudomonadota bacterium]
MAWPLAAVLLLLVSLGLPQVVLAAEGDDEDELLVEEVVVTGSRVRRSDFSSTSPITVITGQALLESGFSDISEAIRRQVSSGTGGFNQSSILSGGGATSVDLRNIGQSRVLVLINGKRVASFADALSNQAADLTFLPNAMIERVDILRDGAAAVYGSDAITGVINVILKEDFEGVQVGATHGLSGEGDAERYTADFALGTTTDRGSIVVGAEYRYQNNLDQTARDWSFPNITSLSSAGTNNGSFFGPGGTFLGDGGALFCTEPVAFGGDEITNIAPNCPSFRGQSNPNELARYDYGLQQDIFNSFKVLTTSGYGVYELTEGMDAFLEMQYSKRLTESRLDGNPGSFGTPGVPDGWRVPASNPNNPFGEAGSYFVRPTSTVGPRTGDIESDTIRTVAGIRGEIFADDDNFLNGWSYELSWLFTRVDADIRTDSTWNLLRAVTISDPDLCAADIICAATVNPTGALDVFRPGNWTDAEIGYIRQNTIARNEFQTTSWQGSMTGPLFELPAGEVQVAFGFEQRTEEGFSKPDPVTEAGESVANQVFTTEGNFTVNELFAEVDVPLLEDIPFAQELTLNAQYRWFDYDTFGSDDVYRIGMNWQISDDIRIRGNFSTAFRSPQVTDLFGGGVVSFDFFTHPCSDPAAFGNANAVANCALAGIPLGTTQAGGGQFAALAGSSPDLDPETADTSTIGFIFTPSFLDGFSLAVDYWDISVDNLIGRNTSDSVVDNCFNGDIGLTDENCDNFETVLLASGQLVIQGLENQTTNLDNVSTDGVDMNMQYEWDFFGGSVWQATLQGTYVRENTFYPGAGGADDRGSIPRIRGLFDLNVDWQSWDFRWGIRYIHGMDDPRFDGNNVLGYSGPPSHTEHDFRVAYNFDKVRVVFGMNDVFDNDPPYVFSTGNNTDLFLYDSVGRNMFLRLQANL